MSLYLYHLPAPVNVWLPLSPGGRISATALGFTCRQQLMGQAVGAVIGRHRREESLVAADLWAKTPEGAPSASVMEVHSHTSTPDLSFPTATPSDLFLSPVPAPPHVLSPPGACRACMLQ